jgi:arginase
VPLEEVASDPSGAGMRVLDGFAANFDRLLIHFDVDTLDFTDAPLSENMGRNEGLSLDSAMSALASLLSSERLSALTITELNPLHGAEDGATLERFAGSLAVALSRKPRPTIADVASGVASRRHSALRTESALDS